MGWDHRISCKECKEALCIARNKKLYRDDDSLDSLEAFLNKHADHELIFDANDDYPRVDNCTRFEIEYELESCPKCLQMTNHLNGVCLKCRSKENKNFEEAKQYLVNALVKLKGIRLQEKQVNELDVLYNSVMNPLRFLAGDGNDQI